MLFSSISFLFYFLVGTLILYFAAPRKLKNTVLLLASLFFYAWGGITHACLMVAAILMGYVAGLLIERYRGRRQAKVILALAVLFVISFMLYFKYADFFIDNFNKITGASVALLRIVLPIGISFYTFQIISYLVDVYRGEKAQHNPINLATYIAMFPQLIAGPIVRYADIARELTDRKHTFEDAAAGIRRFLIGLSKKVLIANLLGELVNQFRATDEKTVLFYWLYAIAFALHIYFDFSGYSDMAIGLGRVFGFHFTENFQYPYIAGSATEFWRRWHISLGSWFRDYVYIPLGGNRVPKWRWLVNIFIVWFLTGFWHGAAWTFIVWGLYFAVLLTVEKLWLLKPLKKVPVLSHIYLLFVAMIGFVIFNAADMPQALSDIGGLFGAGGIPFASAETLYYLRSYGTVLLAAIIGATPLLKNTAEKLTARPRAAKVLAVIEPCFLVLLLVTVTGYLVDGSFNPFLYFRF